MLESLKIFRLVAQQASFTRAARLSSLTRPAVSRHIKLLEDHFGLSLLARTTRHIALTPAGETLQRYAERLLEAQDEMEQAMAALRRSEQQILVVGASTLPGEYLLPRVLSAFRARQPDRQQVQVRVGNTDEVLQWLRAEEVDLALVGRSVADGALASEPLAEDELVLAVPPNLTLPDPLPLAELRRLPLILREPGSATRATVLAALQGPGMRLSDLQVVAEMGSPEAIKGAVRTGMGCAFLSAASLHPGELRVVRLAGLSLRRQVFACWRKDHPPAGAFRILLEQLAAPGRAGYTPAVPSQ